MKFNELGLKQEILTAIAEMGFETPSEIQAEVIPYLLNETGDVVGLAQTGTGKTAAFGLPILQTIDPNAKTTQALILSPTRELCVQIAGEVSKYAKNLPMHIVAVYGGEDIRKQLKEIDTTPQILVATPGRLIDLMERKKVHLENLNYLVLDEADEMLNMGFLDDINTILEKTPDTRRTLLFSATMPAEISKIAMNYMKEPVEISVGKKNEAAKNVEHYFVLTKQSTRYEVLKRLLDYYPDIYGIVFCRTRQETKDVAEKLMVDGYNADALHGDLSQAQRDSVMNKFRLRALQILVATDVAARGLDVNDLTHVIHYNLPDDRETYTHRSGRTGRVNKSGISIALVTPREKGAIKPIERAINHPFNQMEIPSGGMVCQKQLYYMVEKMQNLQPDKKIERFMPDVIELLKDMDRDDIIRRFIALQFNQLLEYYHNSTDLNASVQQEINSNKKRSSSDGKNRRGAYIEDDGFKKSRRQMRVADKGDTLRLKINRGKKDGFEPKRLLGLINDVTGDKSINIGDIDISPRFTFFDVDKKRVKQLLQAFAASPRAKGYIIGEVKGNR
ncbi:MAG: DEAD/DEAH box helicase [Paludibacteraceae bacterium]|nr:DEAD/DEAH box helicase [Paludibacteraceae bacterium]